MAKQYTLDDIKVIKAQTKSIAEQVSTLKAKSKLVDGISAKEEATLATMERQLAVNRKILAASKKTTKAVNSQKSARGKMQHEFNALSDKQKEILKTEYQYDNLAKDVLTSSKLKNKAQIISNDLALEQRDLAIAQVKAGEKIGTEQYSSMDLQSRINDLLEKRQEVHQNYTGKNVELGNALKSQIDTYLKQSEIMKDQAELQELTDSKIKEMNSKIKEMNDKWINVKASVMSIVKNPMTALKVGVLAIGAGLVAMGKKMMDFGNDTGFSYTQLVKFGPAIMFAKEELQALINETGSLNDVSQATIAQMKILS